VFSCNGIAWAGTKLHYACDEAYEKSVELRDLIDSIPVNVTRSVPTDNAGYHIPKFSFRNVNHFSHKKLKISKRIHLF
jgi:hypothetical protein